MELAATTAIIGVGATDFRRDPDRSPLAMASEALHAALVDAALEKSAIDGLIVQVGSPRGVDYDSLALALGLDLQFCSQTWAHGRFAATVLIQAMMAVRAGLATRVACVMAMKNSDLGRIGEAANPFFSESFREGGGPHGEDGLIGMSSPVAGAAMAFQIYCRRYGLEEEKLAAIPLTFRKHAQLAPDAVMRDPMTLEDYLGSRMIVAPLRLLDCSPVGDGAICIIISDTKTGKSSPQPVTIQSVQGLQASRDHFIFAPRGLGMGQQSEQRLSLELARRQSVWRMAGVQPTDIDILGVYDSFSPLPLYALEDFGFCGAGEGLDFVQHGSIGVQGDLPINTAGGQLSQAQMNGWGQIRELVQQLRGGLGERQVSGAAIGMWIGVGGDAMILGN